MRAHPAADLFPMIEGADLAALVEDIREHGLREAVWLDAEGRILDGRNRAKACEIAGVEIQTRVFHGDDPVSFVVSQNIYRRHLTVSQRGIIGARLLPELAAEAKARQVAGLKRGDDLPVVQKTGKRENWRESTSDHVAGKAVGVSHDTIHKASVVAADPEAEKRVMNGETTVGAEYKQIKDRSKGENNCPGNVGDTRVIPKRRKDQALRARRIMSRVLDLSRELESIDVAQIDTTDAHALYMEFDVSTGCIRKFLNQLKGRGNG